MHHLCIVLCVHQPESPSSTIYFPITVTHFPLLPFPLVITILLSMFMRFFFFCLIPSPISPSPAMPSLLKAARLLSVYESLFCLLVYFCSLIPHMSEIIWYLSFSDFLGIYFVSCYFTKFIHQVLVFFFFGGIFSVLYVQYHVTCK